nr:S8 family serine peptidase [Candidatus Sigynarchaeum springense]
MNPRILRLVACCCIGLVVLVNCAVPRPGGTVPLQVPKPARLWIGAPAPEYLLGINETFWATGTNGSGQSIAIIDTGITASHEAFAGKSINWTDVTRENYSMPVDLNGTEAGHGTMCASIAAGNSATYKGIAPGADIAAIKMFYMDGGSITAENADARAAVDRVLAIAPGLNIKVASLSWGDDNASDGNDELSQIVEDLVDGGIVTVVAAGNKVSGGKPARVAAPGASEKVLTVGSLDEHRFSVAYFSLPGPTADNRIKPDIIAPGVDIQGAQYDSTDQYNVLQGTSFSTPIVAGIAALLVGRYPSLDHYQLKHLLCLTALESQYTSGNPDNQEGWGIVNPAGVVSAMERSWSLATPLAGSLCMNKSSTRSFFTRVHLATGVTHRFTITAGGEGNGMLDGRAEAYIYPASRDINGVPRLLARSHGGKLLFAPGVEGDYILAIKPLPDAWSAEGGNLVVSFAITHAEDLTIQASWGIGIASAVAGAVLVLAMALNIRDSMTVKKLALWKKKGI